MAFQSPVDYHADYDSRYHQQSLASPMSVESMSWSLSDGSNYASERSSPSSQCPQQFVDPTVLDYGPHATNYYSQTPDEQMSRQEEPASPKTARSKNPKGSGTRFPCLSEGCESDFGRVTDLKRHYNSVHTPVRIDCHHKWCGRIGAHGFTRRDHFDEHRREVHGERLPKGSNRRNSSEKRLAADDHNANVVSSGTHKRAEKSNSRRKNTSSKSTRDAHRQSPGEISRPQDPSKKMLKVETSDLPAENTRLYLQPQVESKAISTSKRRKQAEDVASYGTTYYTKTLDATIRGPSARR